MKFAPKASIISVALLLSACTTPRPELASTLLSPSQQLQAEIDAYETTVRQPDIPPEVIASLLPPVSRDIPRLPENRFDIDVHEVDARTFFLSLLHDTAENIVVHPSVTGTLTLSLRNVTVSDTLEAVRDVYGYDIRRTSSGWQVFPAAMQSRMFNVNYINLAREGFSETRVSSGQLVGGEEFSAGRNSAPASSQIRTTNASNFWSELEQSLQVILGLGGEDGAERMVVVNPHTGIVMVRGMPAELREVERFLNTLQKTITRQVLIEARILEVELGDRFQAGINWAGIRVGSDNVSLGGQGVGYSIDGSPTGTTVVDLVRETGFFTPFDPVSGLDRQSFGGMFGLALRLPSFAVFIEALKEQGDVNVLSSPRIATLNNQKAVIKIGSDEFFVTSVSSNTTTTGVATTISPDIELTPFFSGIALDVTPHIDDAGNIVMHVRPSVTEVVDQTKTLTVFGEQQTLPLAFSSTRESDSIVRARSGEIIVIGGLMQDVQYEQSASVPIVGDLPLLGAAFRHTRQERRKTELVILLRPIIVDDGQAWRNDLRDVADRLELPRSEPIFPR